MNTKVNHPLRNAFLVGIVFCIFCIISPVAAVHIKTVDEGLLSDPHCYVGAYLGGDMGVNGPNHYKATGNIQPYESQVLDGNVEFGSGQPDTGIDTFRSMAGSNNILFSRYINLMWSGTDSTYEKKENTAGSTMWGWADAVIQKGGVPVVVVGPYGYTTNGLLDLKAKQFGVSGEDTLKKLVNNLDQVSKKNGDATIIIVFGHEAESHSEVNPTSEYNKDGPHHQAYRQMFRQAADIIHNTGNKNLQTGWVTNVCDDPKVKLIYWPENDDSGKDMNTKYVDWVGQDRYHATVGYDDLAKMKPFYKYYSEDKNRPFMFMETSGWGSASLSQEWIKKLYNAKQLQATYPNIKGIIWFNVKKVDNDGALRNFFIPNGDWVDHGADTRGEVTGTGDDYKNAVNDPYFFAATVGTPGTGVTATPTKLTTSKKLPDLRVTAVNSARVVNLGSQFSVNSTLFNSGTASAKNVIVFYYLKSNDGTNIRVGQSNIPEMTAGMKYPLSARILIPKSFKQGIYYLQVVADPTKVIVEADESNNAGSSPIPLRLR